jgi:hypothetical protein
MQLLGQHQADPYDIVSDVRLVLANEP